MKHTQPLLAAALALTSLPALAQSPDPGARLPWDYPLPPISFMLNPKGVPPNGAPPETTGAPEIPVPLAETAGKAALDSCVSKGINVAVAIVGAAGDLRYGITADHAPPGKIFDALRKSESALAFRVPNSQIPAILKADPAKKALLHPGMALFPGAIPLVRDGKLYGAVAVGGAPASAEDEACAIAGVNAIAGRW